MDGKKFFILLIFLVAVYFFYKNFDFETKTLKTSDKLIEYKGGEATQQSELHEAAKSL